MRNCCASINSTVLSLKNFTPLSQEQYCYVAQDFAATLADPGFKEESVRLPDGNMIVMGRQKFSAPEIIFQPSLASKKTCGLGELLYYSLMKCEESVRGELAANITLSGGNTKFPGLERRLGAELSNLLPDGQEPRVRALPNRCTDSSLLPLLLLPPFLPLLLLTLPSLAQGAAELGGRGKAEQPEQLPEVLGDKGGLPGEGAGQGLHPHPRQRRRL